MESFNNKVNSNEKKVMLIVRDGYGYTKRKKDNAILKANTPFTDKLEKEFPTILLNASGEAVGLPAGFMGNSEVGHMTMGAGRAVEQSLLRINKSIDSKEFFKKENFLKLVENINENNSTLHLIILLQNAGVHSHINHLFKTLDFLSDKKLRKNQVALHLITDGRDASTTGGIKFLKDIADSIYSNNIGFIATISGRYYAMDRNKNWDRIEKAYNVIVKANGKNFKCGFEYLDKSYSNEKNQTDEFVVPGVRDGYKGFSDNDSVFFLNFRKDRARELTHSFLDLDKDFTFFNRGKRKKISFLAMTSYYQELPKENVLFPDLEVKNTVGEILDKNNKTQLRISESEKFAHVTFFFDGGGDYPSEKIDKIIIPSPKVATYDLKPQMSNEELTAEVLQNLNNKNYDFILLNYPNADMVGHTGNFDATVKAIETIDNSLSKVVPLARKKGYNIVITADHGNAENVSKKFTSHTKNPVKCTIVSDNQDIKLKEGEFDLGSVGSTVLQLFCLKKASQMDEGLIV